MSSNNSKFFYDTKKYLRLTISILIIVFDIIKLIYYNEFLFSLISTNLLLVVMLFVIDFISAILIILNKKVYIFSIVILLPISFQIFSLISRTIIYDTYSESLFLSIAYFIAILILFNLAGLTAYLFSKKQFNSSAGNSLFIIIIFGLLLWIEYNYLSTFIKTNSKQKNDLELYSTFFEEMKLKENNKSGILKIFLNTSDFDCNPCFDNLLGLNNFLYIFIYIFLTSYFYHRRDLK